jgi:nitrate reductase NapE component
MRGTWQTTDSGGSGGGLVLAVIVVVVLIGSGAAARAASAVASLLVTLAIVFGAVIAVAVLGGIGFLIWRARSERPGRPIAAAVVRPLPPATRPGLEEPSKPAFSPAREVHLHLNVSADELAAIVRHYTEEN